MTDEQMVDKVRLLKSLVPIAETEMPTKDFTRLASLLDLMEASVLTKAAAGLQIAVIVEYEEEWFRVTGDRSGLLARQP